jgi:hypothetical protein
MCLEKTVSTYASGLMSLGFNASCVQSKDPQPRGAQLSHQELSQSASGFLTGATTHSPDVAWCRNGQVRYTRAIRS